LKSHLHFLFQRAFVKDFTLTIFASCMFSPKSHLFWIFILLFRCASSSTYVFCCDLFLRYRRFTHGMLTLPFLPLHFLLSNSDVIYVYSVHFGSYTLWFLPPHIAWGNTDAVLCLSLPHFSSCPNPLPLIFSSYTNFWLPLNWTCYRPYFGRHIRFDAHCDWSSTASSTPIFWTQLISRQSWPRCFVSHCASLSRLVRIFGLNLCGLYAALTVMHLFLRFANTTVLLKIQNSCWTGSALNIKEFTICLRHIENSVL